MPWERTKAELMHRHEDVESFLVGAGDGLRGRSTGVVVARFPYHYKDFA